MTFSFSSLGLSEARVRHLEKVGFHAPTPIQAQAIPHLLSGRDVIGLAQTGTGKTAAFSLPILEQVNLNSPAVQALVLTPTRELATQVYQSVRNLSDDRRLRVQALYGGQSIDTQINRLQRGCQVVVGTPGRVIDLLNRKALKLDQLNWMVLDEADEMLNMGFIQDVEQILSQVPGDRQTALFSATMEPRILELAAKFLHTPITVQIEQPKAAPTRINQVAYMVPRGWTKARALQPILELEDPESALIFVRTRKTAADLTRQLQAAGYSVDEYHGDLSQSQRERLLLRFRQRQVRWVVATDIAARGLHVEDLSHVVNFDLPDSVESYVHRIGRTGRAGKEGTAISLVHPLDKRKLRDIERHIRQRLEFGDIPTRAQIEARHLETLQAKLQEALAGDRLASFLPIVTNLSEDYDLRAIAAAALQMAYDQTRPAWMRNDQVWVEEPKQNRKSRHSSERSGGKPPRPVKRSRSSSKSSGQSSKQSAYNHS